MAPFRNPFNKKPGVNGVPIQDENKPPNAVSAIRPDHLPSRTASGLSLKTKKEEPNEFKLSVVNDSGVYLPPSPTEKKSFWQRTTPTSTVSSHRSMLSENEPFSISRESFDSYRRSFDISARSPVYQSDGMTPRQSLDSRSPYNRTMGANGAAQRNGPTSKPRDDEGFEEVGLNDDVKPKKRTFFSRFGDSTEAPGPDGGSRPNSSHHGFHMPGRKRGQSGQGAELGNVPKAPQVPLPTNEEDGVVR